MPVRQVQTWSWPQVPSSPPMTDPKQGSWQWIPQKSQRPPKPQGQGKAAKVMEAVGGVWGNLSLEVQESLKQAGYIPPEAPMEIEDPLLQVLHQHEQSLPDPVKDALKERISGPPPTATQEGQQASREFKHTSATLRSLAEQKLNLQQTIDATKNRLHNQLRSMQDLQQKIDTAQKEVEAAQKELASKVLETEVQTLSDGILAGLSDVLKELGVSLDPQQMSKLSDMTKEAIEKDSKKRKLEVQASQNTEVPTHTEPPPGLDGPPKDARIERSRSPKNKE